MGEITDALKRAREESKGQRPQGVAPRMPIVESGDSPPGSLDEAPRFTPRAEPIEEESAVDRDVVRIDRTQTGSWAARAVVADQRGRFAACYRQFALRLGGELARRDTGMVLVTSSVSQDGKTTTACNLALAFASMAAGRRIALVELDLRRPSIGSALGLPVPEVGFEQVLWGNASLADVRQPTDVGVDLYLVGQPDENAHEVLARPELAKVLQRLSDRYDTVVCDTPPVLVVPDVSLIIPNVDACVAVARSGATPLSAFRSMAEILPKEKLVGVFVNDERKRKELVQHYYYRGSNGSKGAD